MRHTDIDSEKLSDYYCLRCNEDFLHASSEELRCPKCGTVDEEWLVLVLPDDDDERPHGK